MTARIRLFSKRHERAIDDRRLALSLPRRLRLRLWYTLTRFTYEYETSSRSGYREITDTQTEIERDLKERYGVEHLEGLNESDEKVQVDLQGFVLGAYPSQVLDVIELWFSSLGDHDKLDFQHDVNMVFEEENCNWRLADGQFFQVNSEFMSLQVVARSYELLKAEAFEGALDEFNESRNDLEAGDPKGAIHNACKSFESVLKTLLGEPVANASVLIRKLVASDFCGDIPPDIATAFGEQVLNSLPFLRNRLAGHGQGESRIEVPKLYAQLAVHLAGAFILFAVSRSTEMRDAAKPSDPTVPLYEDDDIPF